MPMALCPGSCKKQPMQHMKRFSTIAIGAFALLVTATALAVAAWSTNPVLLTGVRVDTGVIYLNFGTAPNNKPVCGSSTWGILDPTLSSDSVKATTTIATAAFLAGKTVEVLWTGTCTGTFAYIGGVSMP
jgi:hypothetical protein